jgi:ABC-2 type transport system ATP-binding protein
MKRRANLVIGILHEPGILILDEPTVGIDPQSRNLVFETLERLNQSDVTIVYTTHYIGEAERLCTRVAVMDKGRIIADNRPRLLIEENPGCATLEDLFLRLTGKHLRD